MDTHQAFLVLAMLSYVDEFQHASSNYDIIIGRDLLHSLGINLLFDSAEIAWDNAKIRMQPSGKPDGEWLDTMERTRAIICP
jgi:hypothetical protein